MSFFDSTAHFLKNPLLFHPRTKLCIHPVIVLYLWLLNASVVDVNTMAAGGHSVVDGSVLGVRANSAFCRPLGSLPASAGYRGKICVAEPCPHSHDRYGQTRKQEALLCS